MLSGARAIGAGGTWASAGITASIEITNNVTVSAVNLLIGITPSILFVRDAKAGTQVPAWGTGFGLQLNC
jgi:hypothetical protein